MYIGITGKIGAGKSTLASILRDMNFTERSFATPLKQCAVALGFTSQQVYGSQKDKAEINDVWSISAREFMQKFGTEICREVLPTLLPSMSNCWIKLAMASPSGSIVWSDVRFADEAAAIKELGGIILEIRRGSPDDIAINVEGAVHSSEQQEITVDYVIDNSGTIDDLRDKIHSIITDYAV